MRIERADEGGREHVELNDARLPEDDDDEVWFKQKYGLAARGEMPGEVDFPEFLFKADV